VVEEFDGGMPHEVIEAGWQAGRDYEPGDVVKVIDDSVPEVPEVPEPKLHPWLHPTKGWREHARQTKTNRRRKLSAKGRARLGQAVIDARAARVRQRDELVNMLREAGMNA
jgi:hypothetical protein